MWSDNDTDLDYLNFAGVADTVAELIEQAKGKPISIGIAGAWGVGKSSMIRLVQNALEQRDSSKKFLYVNFNAWLYQGYDDARAALMDVIGETLLRATEVNKSGFDKTIDFLKRVRVARLMKLAGNVAAVAAGLPPPALLDTVLDAASRLVAGKDATEDVKVLRDAGKKVAEGGGGFLDPKEVYSPPQEINALRESFKAALKELDVTLVVLIDDLDRCLPETTISTLEAIRLFLFLERTAFVLAADDQMIRHAVRKHFSGIEDELVTNYFDKLIQITMRVPPLGTAEVRAYMMLLHVENSDLLPDDKEKVRSATIVRLRESWQGKRVDLALMQGLGLALPKGLLERLESANRLAPIMASGPRLLGNPRLIKRFLNMLSIRMTIARSHGIMVDEGVVTKLLLLERCASPALYAKIATEVMQDDSGHSALVQAAERIVGESGDAVTEAPWNEPFLRDWLRLSPKIGSEDLRGALYVSREHAPLMTPEDRLSPEGVEALEALRRAPEMTSHKAFRDKLPRLAATERATLMRNALDGARREQKWGTPAILTACVVIADADTAQAALFADFLMQLPSLQLQPGIVPKIASKPWAKQVIEEWKLRDDLPREVRNAIGQPDVTT